MQVLVATAAASTTTFCKEVTLVSTVGRSTRYLVLQQVVPLLQAGLLQVVSCSLCLNAINIPFRKVAKFDNICLVPWFEPLATRAVWLVHVGEYKMIMTCFG